MSEDAFDKIVNDVRYSPFQRQLAARLGCDVEMVTVENLEQVFEALRECDTVLELLGYIEMSKVINSVLEPFKREVG